MLARLQKTIVSFPRLVILLAAIGTAFFAYAAQQGLFDEEGSLIIDSTLKSYIARDSDQFEFFEQTRRLFGEEQLMVVALQPTGADSGGLDVFLAIHELARRIEKGVPGVSRVIGITDAVQRSGECIGKSYFHQVAVGSVCESILERYTREMKCLADVEGRRAAADSGRQGGAAAFSGLGENLDEEPDLPLDAPEQASLPARPERQTAGDGPLDPGEGGCTADIYRKTPAQVAAEADAAVAQSLVKLRQDPLIQKDLVSPDFRTYGLVVQFLDGENPAAPATQLALDSLVREAGKQGFRTAYTGRARQQFQTAKTFRQDIARIFPFSVAVMMLILALSFRSVRGVLLPMAIVLLGLIWTAGIFALAGQQLNPVLMVLPPLLICVGSAYVIFFMNQYFTSARGSNDRREVIAATMDGVALPLTVTALTTMAGFAALIVSPIPAIKTMGIFACLGVFIMILMLLTLVPSVLVLMPLPRSPGRSANKAGWLDVGLQKVSSLAGIRSKYFIYLWIAIGVFAVLGILKLEVNSDAAAFGEGTPIMQDLRFIESRLAGTGTLRIVWRGKDGTANLKTAATMRVLGKLEDELFGSAVGRIDGVKIEKVYSPVPLLRERFGELETLSDVEVRRFFEGPLARGGAKFFSEDGRWLQMTVRLRADGSTAVLSLRDFLEARAAELAGASPSALEARVTGTEVLVSESADNIAKGQAISVALALIIIFVILSILFFSPKMGLLALYPNILTISVYFGVLGWLDIPLGVTISVIGAIALGLGVDDTIHYLAHYSRNVRTLRDEREAAMLTVRQVGRPMIYTSVALTLGFLVFMASDMETQNLFGALLAFTLVVCLLTDLNFLPSIMAHTKLITVWDYFGLDFTPEFIRTIPLFRGMSLRETKLATLMAYPVELARGEILFEEQSMGRELFVVLSGDIEIYFDEKFHETEQLLASLPTGSAFGEMGLFRQRERIASARAKETTHLLAINSEVLENLQRRYPRIATKLFLNLAATLSQRIHQSDEQFIDKLTPQTRLGSVMATVNAFLKQVNPTTGAIKAAVDEIVADGVVTIEERRALETKIYADGVVSLGERRELDRLERMISEGSVREARDQFISMLEGVRPGQIAWLKSRFPVKNFEPGEEIRSLEQVPQELMLILSGKVIVHQKRAGELLPMRTIYRDEAFGEDAILPREGLRKERILALDPTRVLLIDPQGFEEIMARKKVLAAQLAHNLVRMLSDWLQEANVRLHSQ